MFVFRKSVLFFFDGIRPHLASFSHCEFYVYKDASAYNGSLKSMLPYGECFGFLDRSLLDEHVLIYSGCMSYPIGFIRHFLFLQKNIWLYHVLYIICTWLPR